MVVTCGVGKPEVRQCQAVPREQPLLKAVNNLCDWGLDIFSRGCLKIFFELCQAFLAAPQQM